MTWPAALGMAAEANRAERAVTAGDQVAWVRNQDPEADSGVILLPHSMPAGYGRFSYEARSDAQLTSQTVQCRRVSGRQIAIQPTMLDTLLEPLLEP
jgi:hypothetical protein